MTNDQPQRNPEGLSLLTDLYQLTMAYGYWQQQLAEREAVFHLTFRRQPFGGGYSLACGLQDAIEYLRAFRFSPDDLEYLGTLCGNDDKPLFERGFLRWLREMQWTCDVDAMPEGTVVFPNEPLVRVQGPMAQCQLVETALLNILNFQTLIATKASRICLAARGEPVLEFGARRAQGTDGALTASRAAYIGGCAATSNVLAGKIFGIPVKGTHAHSWVMLFDSELEAFLAYAEAMPNNCVFLVDTYDTLDGVRHAIEAGRKLRADGHELSGIRLDSGDLAYLSVEARKLLDEAGFPKAQIVASNDLDETIIASLKEQGAAINVWGVGTRLVTGHEQPALGGVYKLSAVREPGQAWTPKIKVSEQTIKISNPGVQGVRRYFDPSGMAMADLIHDVVTDLSGGAVMVDPLDATKRRRLPSTAASQDLLVPVFRQGRCVYQSPSMHDLRDAARANLKRFAPGIKRFVNPHLYAVGLEESLHEQKTRLIVQARRAGDKGENSMEA